MLDKLRSLNVEAGGSLRSINREGEFYEIWISELRGQADLLARAIKGGAHADRFAWVFLSGYQSAIKHTFPEINGEEWSSFAVSEDKKGELPGLSWREIDGIYVLDGYKTWVAGVDNLETLIVKAGRGKEALYFWVERKTEGLTFSKKEKGFLPEMSEGVAYFQSVELGQQRILSAELVKGFGKREILYIYAAFCGLVINRSSELQVVEEAWKLVDRIAHLIPTVDSLTELKAIDVNAQELRMKAKDSIFGVVGWEKDQKLIAMYSNGIQAR